MYALSLFQDGRVPFSLKVLRRSSCISSNLTCARLAAIRSTDIALSEMFPLRSRDEARKMRRLLQPSRANVALRVMSHDRDCEHGHAAFACKRKVCLNRFVSPVRKPCMKDDFVFFVVPFCLRSSVTHHGGKTPFIRPFVQPFLVLASFAHLGGTWTTAPA